MVLVTWPLWLCIIFKSLVYFLSVCLSNFLFLLGIGGVVMIMVGQKVNIFYDQKTLKRKLRIA